MQDPSLSYKLHALDTVWLLGLISSQKNTCRNERSPTGNESPLSWSFRKWSEQLGCLKIILYSLYLHSATVNEALWPSHSSSRQLRRSGTCNARRHQTTTRCRPERTA